MHPNGELVMEVFEAFGKGDMDTLARVFDDDIQWHDVGASRLSGDYRGKEEVFGYFGKLMELTEGTFRVDLHAILADDDHVVVLTERSHDKPHPIANLAVFVWHVRDGKAVECWDITSNQAEAAAALG